MYYCYFCDFISSGKMPVDKARLKMHVRTGESMSIAYLIGFSCKSLTSFDVLFFRLVKVLITLLSVIGKKIMKSLLGAMLLQCLSSCKEIFLG